MKVVVLFDGISALGKSPDLAILETVEAVEAILAGDGHEAIRMLRDSFGDPAPQHRGRVALVGDGQDARGPGASACLEQERRSLG